MHLDLQGSIQQFTLPEIFQLVAGARKSGTLGIQREDSIVMIYFREGMIVYAYGPRQTFHLGQLLKEQGAITGEQLDKTVAVQSQNENSRRLGEILIQQGYIDRADLEKVVKNQIEQLLYSLLAWDSGTFKFYEDQFPTDEEITVTISVENVILEGLRRIDEKRMVEKTLPGTDSVFALASSETGRKRMVSLSAEEWNIMALVDSRRSAEQITRESALDRDLALKTLAQLKLAGLITDTGNKATVETGPTAESPALEKMVNRLAHLFEQYLTQKSGGQGVISHSVTRMPTEQK